MTFNEKLFKPSNGFYPFLCDDWKIKNTDDEYVYLMDSKNQQFCINSGRFFDFIFREKISIINNEIKGHFFIIDNNNQPTNEKKYNEWLKQTKENAKNEINKKDLKEGCLYLDETNRAFIYLGKRYISSYSFVNDKLKFNKPTLKYIAYKVYEHDKYQVSNNYHNFFNINKKIVKEIIPSGAIDSKADLKPLKISNVDELLEGLYFEHRSSFKKVFYMSKIKEKGEPNIDFVEFTQEELISLNKKYDYSFLNCFHKDKKDRYWKNNCFIYTDNGNKNLEYGRSVFKSDFKVLSTNGTSSGTVSRAHIGTTFELEHGKNVYHGLPINPERNDQVILPHNFHQLRLNFQ